MSDVKASAEKAANAAADEGAVIVKHNSRAVAIGVGAIVFCAVVWALWHLL